MRGRPKGYSDFTGGLCLLEELAPNQSPNVLNVRPGKQGGIRKRIGDSALDQLGGDPLMSLVTGYTPGIGGYVMIANDTADDIFFNGTFVANVPAASGGLHQVWSWVPFHYLGPGPPGPWYGVASGHPVGRTMNDNGTSLVVWAPTTGTVPSGHQLLAHGNRLWVIGEFGTPNDLRFSALGDALSWPAANRVGIAPDDGDGLVAIATLDTAIAVLKRDRCFLIYDTDTGANRPMGRVGCATWRSCVETPHGLVFLSPTEGFCITTGGEPRTISRAIQPLLDELAKLGAGFNPLGFDGFGGNPQGLASCTAAYMDGSYFAAFEYPCSYTIAGRTEQATILEYDFATESWWRHSARTSLLGPTPFAAGGLAAAKRRPGLVAGSRTGDYVDELLDGSGPGRADGTPLDAVFSTPYAPVAAARARVRNVVVRGGGSYGVRVSRDYRDDELLEYPPAAVAQVGEASYFGRQLADVGLAAAARVEVYNEAANDGQALPSPYVGTVYDRPSMTIDEILYWTQGRAR